MVRLQSPLKVQPSDPRSDLCDLAQASSGERCLWGTLTRSARDPCCLWCLASKKTMFACWNRHKTVWQPVRHTHSSACFAWPCLWLVLQLSPHQRQASVLPVLWMEGLWPDPHPHRGDSFPAGPTAAFVLLSSCQSEAQSPICGGKTYLLATHSFTQTHEAPWHG